MLAVGMSVGLMLVSEGAIASPNTDSQSRSVAGRLIDASVCRPVSGTRERILVRSVRPSLRRMVEMNIQDIVREGELSVFVNCLLCGTSHDQVFARRVVPEGSQRRISCLAS